jgi:hypothetical protein
MPPFSGNPREAISPSAGRRHGSRPPPATHRCSPLHVVFRHVSWPGLDVAIGKPPSIIAQLAMAAAVAANSVPHSLPPRDAMRCLCHHGWGPGRDQAIWTRGHVVLTGQARKRRQASCVCMVPCSAPVVPCRRLVSSLDSGETKGATFAPLCPRSHAVLPRQTRSAPAPTSRACRNSSLLGCTPLVACPAPAARILAWPRRRPDRGSSVVELPVPAPLTA